MGGFSNAPRCPASLTFRDSPALLRQESDGNPVRPAACYPDADRPFSPPRSPLEFSGPRQAAQRTLVAATEGGSPSAAEAPAAKEEEPPADFICPITTEIMVEPVVAADGQSYERTAIERWLATKSTSPLTGGELERSILIPNHNLRRTIREWQEARASL